MPNQPLRFGPPILRGPAVTPREQQRVRELRYAQDQMQSPSRRNREAGDAGSTGNSGTAEEAPRWVAVASTAVAFLAAVAAVAWLLHGQLNGASFHWWWYPIAFAGAWILGFMVAFMTYVMRFFILAVVVLAAICFAIYHF